MKFGMVLKALRFVSFWMSMGACGVLLISILMTPESLPRLPLCSFKMMTGRPCPGCGLTRSFCAISHGRLGQAFHFNPFGFFFYAGTIGLAVWPLLARYFPRLKTWMNQTRLFVWLLPLVFVGMLIYGLLRMRYGPFDI
jgi:uncharacterized membrane protein